MVLLLGSLEALHFFFEDFVDVSHCTSLILQLSGKCRELIGEDCDLTLRYFDFFVTTLKRLSDLNKLALFCLDLSFSLLICLLLPLKTT